jgi:misacylated tRNA(Ala) deacylase
VKGEEGAIILVPAEPGELPPVGATVDQRLDWDRRWGHMRIHTALHLLSVVIELPVTGGAVGAEKGRLDFDMPEAPQDREVLEGQLNALVTRDLAVSDMWITEEELDANPGLVKTLSVSRRAGQGACASCRSGRARTRSTCNPAAAPMWRAPARSGACASPRSRKRAARTGA